MHLCAVAITCLLSVPVLVVGTFRQQSVAVKGIVNCRGIRQPGAFVQLYDEDTIPLMDSDDLLGSATADELGVFCVRGYTTEISVIEPYIYIEHNCGYEGLDKKHFFIRAIPAEFIMEGNFSKKTFHMGDIELLTRDAPVQQYQRRMLIHHPRYHHHHHHHHQQFPYRYGKATLHQQIMQCIPHYVAYRDYYERVVASGGTAYNKTRAEQEALEEVAKRPIGPPHVLGQDKTNSFKAETHTEIPTGNHQTYMETRERSTNGYESPEAHKSTEAIQEELEEQKREEQVREDMKRRREEERLREEEERKRLEEEKRVEEARLREEQLLEEEEKRQDEKSRLEEQQLKEEEEMKRLEEERRRIQKERMEIERQRLKEEEIRKVEQTRHEEERRKEEERRREEARLREEERRREEQQRREEERRRDDEHRKEMEAIREKHLQRIEEFKRLEEQRRLEMSKFEEERRKWKEKMKEEEITLKKKIEKMCSSGAIIRTSEAREKYSDGVDPCHEFKKT